MLPETSARRSTRALRAPDTIPLTPADSEKAARVQPIKGASGAAPRSATSHNGTYDPVVGAVALQEFALDRPERTGVVVDYEHDGPAHGVTGPSEDGATSKLNIMPLSVCSAMWQCAIHRPGLVT